MCGLLGPSINIGPAMTAKILRGNSEAVHRSINEALADEELGSLVEKVSCDACYKSVELSLGWKLTTDDIDQFEV